MMTPAEKESFAQMLMDTSATLGRAIAAVENLERHDLAIVQSEPDACDEIVIEGIEVARAMRTLAMRLDRAALGRYHERTGG